jgi:hypothetical protein
MVASAVWHSGQASQRPGPPAPPTVSFSGDWAAFARLASRVFNINEKRLADRQIADYDVHESASALEIRLIRELLEPSDSLRLEGQLVSGRIDQLLKRLTPLERLPTVVITSACASPETAIFQRR